ncbi:MAG TPA: DUF6567 family protein [Chitinophagales bacterium]
MKKLFIPIFALAIMLLQSCAFHNGLTSNLNNHETSVVLSSNNFKVVAYVRGEASAQYILGIGGLKRKGLIAEAREQMLANADLIGKSRAVINETVEEKSSHFGFYERYRIIVSAYVVEFRNPKAKAAESTPPAE